jgi:hypothetical protein
VQGRPRLPLLLVAVSCLAGCSEEEGWQERKPLRLQAQAQAEASCLADCSRETETRSEALS